MQQKSYTMKKNTIVKSNANCFYGGCMGKSENNLKNIVFLKLVELNFVNSLIKSARNL